MHGSKETNGMDVHTPGSVTLPPEVMPLERRMAEWAINEGNQHRQQQAYKSPKPVVKPNNTPLVETKCPGPQVPGPMLDGGEGKPYVARAENSVVGGDGLFVKECRGRSAGVAVEDRGDRVGPTKEEREERSRE